MLFRSPSKPTFKGSYDTPTGAVGVAFFENYVYVTDGGGLQIIDPHSNKLTLLGTPMSVGTYNVDIKACNEEKECVTDIFDIIVRNSSSTDIELTIILIIVGSIACAICTGLCAFSCGIVTLRRYLKRELALNEQKVPILPKNKKDVKLKTSLNYSEED